MDTIPLLKCSKGHKSVKNVCGVTVFFYLCTSFDGAQYLYQVLRKYLKEFQIIYILNIKGVILIDYADPGGQSGLDVCLTVTLS